MGDTITRPSLAAESKICPLKFDVHGTPTEGSGTGSSDGCVGVLQWGNTCVTEGRFGVEKSSPQYIGGYGLCHYIRRETLIKGNRRFACIWAEELGP